jgi:hypothetical protein
MPAISILWAAGAALGAYFAGQVGGRTSAGDKAKPLEIAGYLALGAAAGYLLAKGLHE